MTSLGMTESVSDIYSMPVSDCTGLGHSTNSLNGDSGNVNQFASIADYVTNLSSTFSGFDLDYDSLISFKSGQSTLSTLFNGEQNVPISGQGNFYDKMESPLTGSFASVYQNCRTNTSDMPLHLSSLGAFNSMHYQGVSNSKQFSSSGDLESLQHKISQKKQTLDILQGVLPDPLANQEKRYMTMTERIQVPSSDHVAEIVGKNGQRIKQLREQLKVWVKTPSRDEPPVFEVTGLPEKLAEAKRIILQMSEHFTKVQQERLHRIEPNRIEDRLYVEQDKVGLIVGASGQTIRWVQQLSDTHIATPRKQESIPGLPPPQTFFTICGTLEKVKFAKQLICEYVTLRCQGLWLDPDLEPSAEASRLVREFHQRRQVEDNQRRTTSAQTPSTSTAPALSRGAQGRALVAGSSDKQQQLTDSSSHSVKQLIADIEAWGVGKSGASSAASSGQESPRKSQMWNPMIFGLGVQDRRFSADGGVTFDGQDALSTMKKSASDDQVSPQLAGVKPPGAGWM